MQPCVLCGCTKPLSEFTFRNDSRKHRTECKSCRANQSAADRAGIDLEDVEALKAKQNNCCAICGLRSDAIEHATFKHNPLVIDHDHSTGKVRGLLCSTWNNLLGHAHDSIDTLLRAVKYLQGQLP